MKINFRSFFCGTLLISLHFTANLAHSSETNFEYPELSVVPRASEQITNEAAKEKDQILKNNLPYLFPASVTFLNGLFLLSSGTKSDTDPSNTMAKTAPWIGMGVGLAWWAASYTVLNRMDYYGEGLSEVSKLPAKTQREQLLRERKAEEAITQAGSMARRLKWISIGTNVSASALMAISAKKNTFPLYFSFASVITSFTPLLFPHRWETVDCMHRDYKKRIYAPVIGATMLQNPTDSSLSPGLTLALQF